jgi:arylsulfatase A
VRAYGQWAGSQAVPHSCIIRRELIRLSDTRKFCDLTSVRLSQGPQQQGFIVKRRDFLKTIGLGAGALALPGRMLGAPEPQRKPNIVFVLADDMGYGDVGCYNADSKISTPNMDRLAKEGVRLTDAHSPSSVCTPTRYGILTGRHCWRTWLKSGVVGGYTNPLIEPSRTTVGSFLKKHGYTTACIGKWHLGLGWTRHNGYVGSWKDAEAHFDGSWQDGDPKEGMNVDFTKPIHGGPNDLGFDYAYYTAACSTIDGPFCYIENDRTVGIPNKPIFVDKKKHPDYRPRPGWIAPGFVLENVDMTFTNKAIEFVGRSNKKDPAQPFFVYLALSAPHAPWLPPAFVQGKSEAGPRGDQVVLVDWCVGRIVKALERMRLTDKTLLIVTSDNGPRRGVKGHKSTSDLRGYKSHIWEGGHRVPFIARWPSKIRPNLFDKHPAIVRRLTALLERYRKQGYSRPMGTQ